MLLEGLPRFASFSSIACSDYGKFTVFFAQNLLLLLHILILVKCICHWFFCFTLKQGDIYFKAPEYMLIFLLKFIRNTAALILWFIVVIAAHGIFYLLSAYPSAKFNSLKEVAESYNPSNLAFPIVNFTLITSGSDRLTLKNWLWLPCIQLYIFLLLTCLLALICVDAIFLFVRSLYFSLLPEVS